jgi:hypothetical protein
VRLAPDAEPVGRRSHQPVAVALLALHLQPAFAAILGTDWIIIDRRIKAEMVAGDKLPSGGTGSANLVSGLERVARAKCSSWETRNPKLHAQTRASALASVRGC